MAILHVNPLANFPNCPNFKVWEAFTTTQRGWEVRSTDPALKNTTFSPRLFKEFSDLSETDKQDVWVAMCQRAILLQFARDFLKFPIPIASWYRSRALNSTVGSKSPRHMSGGAVDPKLSGEKLAKFLAFHDKFGGGLGTGEKKGHSDVIRLIGNHDRWKY